MTFHQGACFAIIAGAMAMFAWGRFRYDAIALVALLVAVLSGAVPAKSAFNGFSSDVVVIIACALVISAAITRSGVVEPLVSPLLRRLTRPTTQVPVLAGVTALFSMISKNVGALATMMPIAVRMGRGENSSPSLLLMPMAFLSLLGGLVTLVGTSTNIIASQVREDSLGHPFAMFDFTPVGLALTAIGWLFVSFGWRLLPRNRQPRAALSEVHADVDYMTEARVPGQGWPEALATVSDLKLADRGIMLTGLVDAQGAAQPADDAAPLTPGLVLLVRGEDAALGALFQTLPFDRPRAAHPVETEGPSEELRSIEAVVTGRSPLVGRSVADTELHGRFGIKLLAVSRRGAPIRERMGAMRMRRGDLLVLQAGEANLADSLRELGLLPLAERAVVMGDERRKWAPLAIMGAAMALVAAGVLPVGIAFFAAAVLVVAIGSLTMREAYGSLEPDVLILIGALTPLGEAMQHNGGTALIAQALAAVFTGAAPLVLLGGMMLTAMLCAPLLHNAPTVLILAPVSVALARKLGLNPDAFLMAVATGAGSDFLTPIGHQCNTLVRGPGGYRFGDYARLGLPLSLVVLGVGTPLIALVWGLHPGG